MQNRFKELRLERDLSLRDLGERIGLNYSTIACYETRKREPNIETLKKQVDEIIGYFDILSKYDDSENPYDAYPSTQAEKLREDSCVEGLNIPDVKNISKNFMDGYFQVPKVLES